MVMSMLLLEVHSTTPASSVTYCCSILQDTNRETIEVKQNMNKNSNPSSQVGHPQGFLQLQCGVLVKTTNELIQFSPEWNSILGILTFGHNIFFYHHIFSFCFV